MGTNAHFDVINNRNLAQFYFACRTGNMDVVDFALQKKFPINSTVKSSSTEYLGDTALHLVVKAFKMEVFNLIIIEQLFAHGADVTIRNAATYSPIHVAFQLDRDNLINALFAGHGYNRPNVTDRHGLSHFHIACYMSQKNIVENFLKHGVTINDKCGQYSKNPNHFGCTALHFAVNNSSCSKETVTSTVTLLMKYKADVNVKNQAGFNPLQSLYFADFKSNTASAVLLSGDYHEDCIADVQLFKLFQACQKKDIEKLEGALQIQPNVIRASVSNDSLYWPGYTLLHFATFFGMVRVVSFLLHYTSLDDVNATSSKNLTPLHCLLKLDGIRRDESNYIDTTLQITKHLIHCGASIELEDFSGFTPMDYALTLAKQFKKEQFIKRFLETIRLPQFSDNDKLNKLFIACLETDYNYVEQLENNGQLKLLVNMTTYCSVSHSLQGFTPLHFAVYGEDEKMIEILLKNGADFCAQSDKGLSPLHLAERAQNDRIVELILKFHPTKINNPVDRDGLSHLHIACKHSSYIDSKIIPSFIESNIEINGVIEKDIQSIGEYDKPIYTKGDTPLHVIAETRHGNEDLIKLFLDRGADYTLKNADGATPQHLIFTSNAYILDYILLSSTKELENLVDSDGWSYLFIACYLGRPDIVKKFLQKDNNALSEDNNINNETPLHAAVNSGCLQIVEMLLTHGAKVNAKNKYEETPLHYALKIRGDHEHKHEIISCLLSKLVVEETKPIDETGLTLLHIAAIQNDTKTIEWLLKLGLDVNSAMNLNASLWPGITPLHLAVGFRKTDVITLLLNEGADYMVKTKNGIFPFGFTVKQVAMDAEMYDSCQYTSDSFKNIPLNVFVAITQSKRLLDIINIPIWFHCTIFHVYCHLGALEIIEIMLKLENIDVNCPVDFFSDQYPGYTALHFAVDSGSIESIKILIDHGADLNAEDALGCTPVHRACIQSNLEILKLLIHEGAYINGRVIKHQSNYRNRLEYTLATPLHICALLEKYDFVEFLLKNGADISLKNAAGKSAYLVLRYSKIDSLVFAHCQTLAFFNFNTDDQYDSYLFSQHNQRMLLYNLRNEREKLRNDKTYIDKFTTLSDLITANPQKMYQMKKRTKLQHILFSGEYDEKYPYCGFILKLQFQRGLEYKSLLRNTRYSIKPFVKHLNSTYLPLPELCIEKILEYLDKDGFENLVEISNSIILNRTWFE